MLKEQVCHFSIHWGSDVWKKIVSFVFKCPQITEFASPSSFICLTNTFYMLAMYQALLQTLELIVGRDWQKHINTQTSISDDCIIIEKKIAERETRGGRDMIQSSKASREGDIGQRPEGNETGIYRVCGGRGGAACVGSVPDQLYKKCKTPGRNMCLRNSSKKTSGVTVEWGRAGPVWDESKVVCEILVLGFCSGFFSLFFFFGLGFDLGE